MDYKTSSYKQIIPILLISLLYFIPYNGMNIKAESDIVQITATVIGCGDGVINGIEQCDGINLDSQTCSSQGYVSGGSLSCTLSCTFNTNSCIPNPSAQTNTPSGTAGIPYNSQVFGGNNSGNNAQTIFSNIPKSSIVFSGTAKPLSVIQLYKNGFLLNQTKADNKGLFTFTIINRNTGLQNFVIRNDNKNKTVQVLVQKEGVVKVSDITLSSTVKNNVTRGFIRGFRVPYSFIGLNAPKISVNLEKFTMQYLK